MQVQVSPGETVMPDNILIHARHGALVASLTILGAIIAGCNSVETQAATQPDLLFVETMAIEPLDRYEVRRVFSGTVRSRRASQLGFERGGMVSKVYVEEGDRVKEGQLIARLDTAQLRVARRRDAAGPAATAPCYCSIPTPLLTAPVDLPPL